MKRAIVTGVTVFAGNAYSQALSRTGNVIEGDSGGGSGGFEAVLTGIIVGAILGAIYAKYQHSQGKEFATDGGAIMGGMIGMFVWPILMILTK